MLLRCIWQRLRAPELVTLAACLISTMPLALGAEDVEEEEVKATPVSTSISVMLLGSIGFMMFLFYLVNWPDRDIRRYSWRVISKTISIFCAVLLFQAFNGVVEDYAIRGRGKVWEVVIDMMQMVVWLTAMQVVLAVTSGAVTQLWGGTTPSMDVVELRVKSWALLFAHLAGFAAINAGGSLQQSVFNASPLETLGVVPLSWLGLFVMYHGFDHVRETMALIDDGEKDEFEYLWDEETEEAEHDVAGLSLSFLMVQSLRFYISGVLPNQEGGEGWNELTSHSTHECKVLFGCGLVCFILSLLPLIAEAKFHDKLGHLSKHSQEWVERLTEVWNNFFTFGNAWCFFYGMKWALASTRFTEESALLGVVLALVLSAVAFLCIFLLDAIVDHRLLGDSEDSEVADAGVEKLIDAMGVLIGFSWEQSFDVAVSVVASSSKELCPPAVSKLVLSVVLVMVVFPAWRLYILKTERDLAEEETNEGKLVLTLAAQEHRDLFFNKEVNEHVLDMAHLKMKQHRQLAFGARTTAQRAKSAGLKHLRVTAAGVVEVEEDESAIRKKRSTGHTQITEPLLA